MSGPPGLPPNMNPNPVSTHATMPNASQYDVQASGNFATAGSAILERPPGFRPLLFTNSNLARHAANQYAHLAGMFGHQGGSRLTSAPPQASIHQPFLHGLGAHGLASPGIASTGFQQLGFARPGNSGFVTPPPPQPSPLELFLQLQQQQLAAQQRHEEQWLQQQQLAAQQLQAMMYMYGGGQTVSLSSPSSSSFDESGSPFTPLDLSSHSPQLSSKDVASSHHSPSPLLLQQQSNDPRSFGSCFLRAAEEERKIQQHVQQAEAQLSLPPTIPLNQRFPTPVTFGFGLSAVNLPLTTIAPTGRSLLADTEASNNTEELLKESVTENGREADEVKEVPEVAENSNEVTDEAETNKSDQSSEPKGGNSTEIKDDVALEINESAGESDAAKDIAPALPAEVESNDEKETGSEEKESDSVIEQTVSEVTDSLIEQTARSNVKKLTPLSLTPEQKAKLNRLGTPKKDPSKDDVVRPEPATRHASTPPPPVATASTSTLTNLFESLKVTPQTSTSQPNEEKNLGCVKAFPTLAECSDLLKASAINTSKPPIDESSSSSSAQTPPNKPRQSNNGSPDTEIVTAAPLSNPDWLLIKKGHSVKLFRPSGLIGKFEWVVSDKSPRKTILPGERTLKASEASPDVILYAMRNAQALFNISTSRAERLFANGFSLDAVRILDSKLPEIASLVDREVAVEFFQASASTGISAKAIPESTNVPNQPTQDLIDAMTRSQEAAKAHKLQVQEERKKEKAARRTAAMKANVTADSTVDSSSSAATGDSFAFIDNPPEKSTAEKFAPGAVTDSSIFPPAAAAIAELVPSVSGSFSAETLQAAPEVSLQSMNYVPLTTMTKPVWVEVPTGLEFALRKIDTGTLAKVAVFDNKRRGSQPIVDPSVTFMKEGVPYEVLQKYLKSTGEKFIPFKVEPSALTGASSPPPPMDTSSAEDLQFVEPTTESASSSRARASKLSSRRPAATADAVSVASEKSAVSDWYEDGFIEASINLERSARRKGPRSASATGSNAGSAASESSSPSVAAKAVKKEKAQKTTKLPANYGFLPIVAFPSTEPSLMTSGLVYERVKEATDEQVEALRKHQVKHMKQQLSACIERDHSSLNDNYWPNRHKLAQFINDPLNRPIPQPNPDSTALPISASLPFYEHRYDYYGKDGRVRRLSASEAVLREKTTPREVDMIEGANRYGAAVYRMTPEQLRQQLRYKDVEKMKVSKFVEKCEVSEVDPDDPDKDVIVDFYVPHPAYHRLIPASDEYEDAYYFERIQTSEKDIEGLVELKECPETLTELTRALMKPKGGEAPNLTIFRRGKEPFLFDLPAAFTEESDKMERGEPFDGDRFLDAYFAYFRANHKQLVFYTYVDIHNSMTHRFDPVFGTDEHNDYNALNGLARASDLKHPFSRITFTPTTPSSVMIGDCALATFDQLYHGVQFVQTVGAQFDEEATAAENQIFKKDAAICDRHIEHSNKIYDLRILARSFGIPVGCFVQFAGDLLLYLERCRHYSIAIGKTATLSTSWHHGSTIWLHTMAEKFVKVALAWKAQRELEGKVCDKDLHNMSSWNVVDDVVGYAVNLVQKPAVRYRNLGRAVAGIPLNHGRFDLRCGYSPKSHDGNHLQRDCRKIALHPRGYKQQKSDVESSDDDEAVPSKCSSSRGKRRAPKADSDDDDDEVLAKKKVKINKKDVATTSSAKSGGGGGKTRSSVSTQSSRKAAKTGGQRAKTGSGSKSVRKSSGPSTNKVIAGTEDIFSSEASSEESGHSTQRSGRGKHKLLGIEQTVDFASLSADGIIDLATGKNEEMEDDASRLLPTNGNTSEDLRELGAVLGAELGAELTAEEVAKGREVGILAEALLGPVGPLANPALEDGEILESNGAIHFIEHFDDEGIVETVGVTADNNAYMMISPGRVLGVGNAPEIGEVLQDGSVFRGSKPRERRQSF